MKPEALDYELLVKAKALIDAPDKWIKGRSHNKNSYEEADRFCSYGAFAKVLGTEDPEVIYPNRAWMLLTDAAFGMCDTPSPVWFNDRRVHDEVMAMWDAAIAKAEALAKG